MRFLIIFFALINTAFAINLDASIEHLGLIQLDNNNSSQLARNIQYPGLGNHQYDNPDCVIVAPTTQFGVSRQQLEKFAELVKLFDGRGALFGDDNPDELNQLEPEIVNSHRPYLKYHLKDLGTYVTGLIVKTSPYLSFSQATKLVFPRSQGPVALQFLRGCTL